jgi:hypothetical protein
MAGLDPAIHALICDKKDVDARDKRGHDEREFIYVPVNTGLRFSMKAARPSL